MISGYHQAVADHYEKYPYPDYPWYAMGSWSALESVDAQRWGLARPAEDFWVVGCGTLAPAMFGRRNYRARILATDLSKKALLIAWARLRLLGISNVDLRIHDLMESQFTNQFDAIDAYGVIHHMVAPTIALKKLSQALRKGGVLRLMVYSRRARGWIEEIRSEVLSQGFQTINEVEQFLQNTHLERRGEIETRMGLADALLNPIVHVFDDDGFYKLLESTPDLRLLRLRDSGNYVAHLQKF